MTSQFVQPYRNVIGLLDAHSTSVAVAALPVQLPELPLVLPVTFPVKAPVNTVDVSSDGRFIIAGTDYSNVYLYDRKGEVLWAKETSAEVVQTCMSSNGDYVGYLTGDGVFSFGVKSSRVLWELSLIHI